MPSAQSSNELGHRYSSPILTDRHWDCLAPTPARSWSRGTYRTRAINRRLDPTAPPWGSSHQFQLDHTALPRSRLPTILPSRTRASLSKLIPGRTSGKMGCYPGLAVSRKRTIPLRNLESWSILRNLPSCIWPGRRAFMLFMITVRFSICSKRVWMWRLLCSKGSACWGMAISACWRRIVMLLRSILLDGYWVLNSDRLTSLFSHDGNEETCFIR